MARRALPAIASFFLSACAYAGSSGEATRDYSEIVEAVLLAQPDVAKQHREFIAEYPDEESMLDTILDYRLCVSRETAGQKGDFERPDWKGNGASPNFDLYGKRWEQSQSRQTIPARLLPEHLRWAGPLSYCPSGTLRIGSPQTQGKKATVYVENTSSAHGWAGEVELAEVDGRWVVQEVRDWWQT